MHFFNRLSGQNSKKQIPQAPAKKTDSNLVAEYSRGSVYLQFGRYYTASDKEERRAKIAAMTL